MTLLWYGLSALLLCSLTIGSTRTLPTSQEMAEPPQGPTDETTQPIPLSHVLQKDGGNSNERPNKYLQQKGIFYGEFFANTSKIVNAKEKRSPIFNSNKSYLFFPFSEIKTVRRNRTKTEDDGKTCYFSTSQNVKSMTILASNTSKSRNQRLSLSAKDSKSEVILMRSKGERFQVYDEGQNSTEFVESCTSSLALLQDSSLYESENGSEIFEEIPENCTYLKSKNSIECNYLKEMPFFNDTEEVDYLVFRNSKNKVLQESDAYKLPNSKTLAFMDGDVMRISPGFLQKCQSEELIVHNNPLSSWSFSWFYAGDENLHSNMTSIDLSNNQIDLTVS